MLITSKTNHDCYVELKNYEIIGIAVGNYREGGWIWRRDWKGNVNGDKIACMKTLFHYDSKLYAEVKGLAKDTLPSADSIVHEQTNKRRKQIKDEINELQRRIRSLEREL